MNCCFRPNGLSDIADKVLAGERLSDGDALRLFESKDLHTVGALADTVARRKNERRASYIVNRYITTPTTVS